MSLLTEYLDFKVDIEDHETMLLPLFHNCSQKEMLTALNRKQLLAPSKECDVFDEKIVYTFYGVSRYISNKAFNEASDNNITCCIIIDSAHCADVIRIYPFDSGTMANKDKFFRDPPIPWEALKDSMNLGHLFSRINKLILLCYPDLEHYLKSEFEIEPQTKTIIVKGKYPWSPLMADIEDLYKVMRDLTTADERRFNYEVQFKDELPIYPDNVLGFVASATIIKAMREDKYFNKYRVHVDNGLFYPKKAFEANNTIGKAIKDLTEDFTLKRYFK